MHLVQGSAELLGWHVFDQLLQRKLAFSIPIHHYRNELGTHGISYNAASDGFGGP